VRRRELLCLAAALAAGCERRAPPPGEVRLWFSYGGNNRKVLLDLVARFNAAERDVHVVPVFQGDYFEGLVKLRTGLYVGSTPTLSHVVGEVVPYLHEAGALEPLDAIGPEVIADLVPEISQAGTFHGGAERPLVALPFNRSTPIAYFNRRLFGENRLEPPRTWTEHRAPRFLWVTARRSHRQSDRVPPMLRRRRPASRVRRSESG